MKFFAWLSGALFATAAMASENSQAAPTELKIETTFMPADCSVKAKTGDRIEVHYTGTLFSNGKKFDSSLDRKSPLPLTLGVGQVIKGWDQGLQGMCVGEKRTLTIPADLAYGSRGAGGLIPPNAALVFTTELVKLEPSPSHQEL